MRLSHPRCLNLISLNSFLQNGHTGHSALSASVNVTFALIDLRQSYADWATELLQKPAQVGKPG
jgi:hypothetical protein